MEPYLEYLARLAEKPIATAEELAIYRPINYGRTAIVLDDERVFILDSEDEQDNLDPQERNDARASNPLWDSEANAPEGAASLPDEVDHRPDQTAIRDQENRGTCVCFAALANLESLLKVQSYGDIDLSEQYANWIFMKAEGRNQCDDGLRTTLAARYLSQEGVCEEHDYPYEDRDTVRTHCTSVPDGQVRDRAIYGIGSFTIIDRPGFFGPSIANPEYLEAILYNGYDIVYGTHVAWGHPDADLIFDVVLDSFGNPLASAGGHAMLMVGYNRTSPDPAKHYFILKNSWGLGEGDQGYYYLSYDYVRTYAKYGYIVHDLRTDMTPLP